MDYIENMQELAKCIQGVLYWVLEMQRQTGTAQGYPFLLMAHVIHYKLMKLNNF